jgi:hypothetical protein
LCGSQDDFIADENRPYDDPDRRNRPAFAMGKEILFRCARVVVARLSLTLCIRARIYGGPLFHPSILFLLSALRLPPGAACLHAQDTTGFFSAADAAGMFFVASCSLWALAVEFQQGESHRKSQNLTAAAQFNTTCDRESTCFAASRCSVKSWHIVCFMTSCRNLFHQKAKE